MKNKIRKFKTGAMRDSSDGKYEYYGTRHPLLEQSFAKYMHHHRKMVDGSLRDANNWWAGWDKEVSLQSMIRHLEDLQAIHAGYVVLECRKDDIITKHYVNKPKEGEYINIDGNTTTIIEEEDCLNAIRFNSQAYLLQILDKKN